MIQITVAIASEAECTVEGQHEKQYILDLPSQASNDRTMDIGEYTYHPDQPSTQDKRVA